MPLRNVIVRFSAVAAAALLSACPVPLALAATGEAATGEPATHPVQTQALPQAPSAIRRPIVLTGGVVIEPKPPGTTALTLDQAIQAALAGNTELVVRREQQKYIAGEISTVINVLLPNLTASAYTQAQEINLAAMGFKPASIKIPGFNGVIPTIVKVNTTDAQLSLSQQLFNVPAFFLYRGARRAADAANWATLSARGGVVLNTGAVYLRTLADTAQVRNAEALLRQDELVYEHARASQAAGVGIHLDTLRAQVQLEQERQALIAAVNAVAEDKIQLNRLMNRPAGQALDLVDAAPFAEFDAMPFDQALTLAYQQRKDLRGLESQLQVAQDAARAVKYERLPTLAFGGFYGVLGETTGLYHGVFTAQGRMQVPVFEEATLRGQKVVAAAQIAALDRQIASRRATIEGDLRDSLLDVETARQLVTVARSNVTLAGQALDDSIQRFTAGVDDNLPVTRAQAALVGAQTQVIQAEYQFNLAKLQLARNTGVVETQYRQYLGR